MDESIQIILRVAGPADASEIARLNAKFNGSTEPPENYAARLVDVRRVDTPLLAEVDQRIVGIANLRLLDAVFDPEPYAEVTELFVVEEHRRKGVGRALLAFAEKLAREAGAAQILILTDFYNNTAQKLYHAAGYSHYDIALHKDLS